MKPITKLSDPRSLYRRTVTYLLGLEPLASNTHQPLRDAPMPSGWIIDGQPMARATVLTESADKRFRSGVWECSAGTFDWHFFLDEIVYILEGEVIVMDERKQLHLRPGDVAHFPAGTVSRWHVPTFVRKFFTHREPTPLGRTLRGL